MQGFIEKGEVLLKDSQKSQNQKNDSDLPLIQIPKLKIRRWLESKNWDSVSTLLDVYELYERWPRWVEPESMDDGFDRLVAVKAVAWSRFTLTGTGRHLAASRMPDQQKGPCVTSKSRKRSLLRR